MKTPQELQTPTLLGPLTLTTQYPYPGSREGVRAIRLLMSTYEEFQIILGVALLIVAILNMKNK